MSAHSVAAVLRSCHNAIIPVVLTAFFVARLKNIMGLCLIEAATPAAPSLLPLSALCSWQAGTLLAPYPVFIH